MNLAPFTPLVVSLALLAMNVLFKNQKHLVIDGVPTYTYPRGIGYFFLICAFLFCIAPWLLPFIAKRDHGQQVIPVGLSVVATSAALFSFIWATRYRVTLDKEAIKCGSFFIRQFRYSDMTRVRYYGAVVKGQFMIYASSSRWPMTIYSSINDFGSFLDEIRMRLPKNVVIERLGRYAKHDRQWPPNSW